MPLYDRIIRGEFSYLLISDPTGLTILLPGASGVEIVGSRKKINTTGFKQARFQYQSSILNAAIATKIDYSVNDGANWFEMVPSLPATASGNTITSAWALIPAGALNQDLLVRAFIVGNGLLSPLIPYVSLSLGNGFT